MHARRALPDRRPTRAMRDVIYEMSRKGLGMTCVVDGGDALLGIITDGDLRRHMERAGDILDADGRRRDDARSGRDRAADARRRGAEHHGAAQDHVDRRRRRRSRAVAGVVHLHDLWRTEMV